MDPSNADDYHLRELEIARNPADPRHSLPTVPANCSRVLDVGCGAGQTLLALNLPSTTEAWGVDVDRAAIALGKQLAPRFHLVVASGERLPAEVRDVDFLYSRVALPYMEIHVALAEMARVMRSDGTLWLALHPARMTLRECLDAVKHRRFRDFVARLYVLSSGAWFWLTGRTVAAPWGARNTESWQSIRGMKLAFARAGLELTSVERSVHFIMTARRIDRV
jgi:ubiquinone/menaquinone biosynthesis C-methylase UbiE